MSASMSSVRRLGRFCGGRDGGGGQQCGKGAAGGVRAQRAGRRVLAPTHRRAVHRADRRRPQPLHRAHTPFDLFPNHHVAGQ